MPECYRGSDASRGGIREQSLPYPLDRPDGAAGEWRLQSFLELAALPGAVPCARLHTRQVMWEWGLLGLRDSVELLVSELATNAVNASRCLRHVSPMALRLLSDTAHVLILVQDASLEPPVRMGIDVDGEGGRGLLLVAALSDQWDWYLAEAGGKVVWAVCGEHAV